jgi:hypothetical protein
MRGEKFETKYLIIGAVEALLSNKNNEFINKHIDEFRPAMRGGFRI